jgi:hypothetical protein
MKLLKRWGWGGCLDLYGKATLEMGGAKVAEGSSSWNLGIGVVVDPNVKTIGDGVEPNAPLPRGETQVRFKEERQVGVLILASFTF